MENINNQTSSENFYIPRWEIRNYAEILICQFKEIYPDIPHLDKLFSLHKRKANNEYILCSYAIFFVIVEIFGNHINEKDLKKIFFNKYYRFNSKLKKEKIMKGKILFKKQYDFLISKENERPSAFDILKKIKDEIISAKNYLLNHPEENIDILECEYIRLSEIEGESFKKADLLIGLISSFTGFTKEEILSESRADDIVLSRILFLVYFNFLYPNVTLAAIGKFLGGRDHSTVLTWVKSNNELFDSVNDRDPRCQYYRNLVFKIAGYIPDIKRI